MIKIYVIKQSNYGVSTPKVKKALAKFLKSRGIVSDTEVDVAIVGENKMLGLAEDYLGEKDVLHNVLTFPASETKTEFISPPDGVIRLGQIVVCYPKAKEEANSEGVMIDDKVIELVNHGALHLLGIHHS
ncbi:rRNA maturation RNase YbeY [Candidatus Woesebacteria bacterium]|nr:MAG: rRNA maturation RNase YbeY [Candidatus Woesebacteria bacterium]